MTAHSTISAAARLQRKRQLIAEGAVHRAGLVLARRQLEAEWQSHPAAPHGVTGVLGAASQLLRNGSMLRALAPLLISGVAMLSRRRSLRRMLRIASAAAATAAAIRFLQRKN